MVIIIFVLILNFIFEYYFRLRLFLFLTVVFLRHIIFDFFLFHSTSKGEGVQELIYLRYY